MCESVHLCGILMESDVQPESRHISLLLDLQPSLSVSRIRIDHLLLKLACSRSVLFSPTSLHPLIIYGLLESEEHWGVSPQPSEVFSVLSALAALLPVPGFCLVTVLVFYT